MPKLCNLPVSNFTDSSSYSAMLPLEKQAEGKTAEMEPLLFDNLLLVKVSMINLMKPLQSQSCETLVCEASAAKPFINCLHWIRISYKTSDYHKRTFGENGS